MQDGQDTYDVRATPTLIVNGEKVDGPHSYEDFAKALEKAAGSS
jgi:protein-disulfide isomerase